MFILNDGLATLNLLQSFSQEEALLDVIVGGIRRINVFHSSKSSTHSAVFIHGL